MSMFIALHWVYALALLNRGKQCFAGIGENDPGLSVPRPQKLYKTMLQEALRGSLPTVKKCLLHTELQAFQ